MSDVELGKRRGRVDTTIEEHDETLDDHEHRLTGLEKFRERVRGALLVLSLMAGTGIVSIFANFIGLI